MLAFQVRILTRWAEAHDALGERRRLHGDAGEVSSTVIIIAILCTLAIAVGAIIVGKVTTKAENIPVS